VDGFIFLAYLLDELSSVAGGTVFPFHISFDDVLALNSRRVVPYPFRHPAVSLNQCTIVGFSGDAEITYKKLQQKQ